MAAAWELTRAGEGVMSQVLEELQLVFASQECEESTRCHGKLVCAGPHYMEMLAEMVRTNGLYGDVRMLLDFVHLLHYLTSSV